jgi:hypothetical protein
MLLEQLASVGIAVLGAMGFAIFWFRHDKAMKAGSPIFMGLMLLGGALGLSSVFFLSEITDWKCTTFPFVFGAGFMCLISAMFAKIWRVAQIFTRKQLMVCFAN